MKTKGFTWGEGFLQPSHGSMGQRKHQSAIKTVEMLLFE